jgi:hypothetical protein
MLTFIQLRGNDSTPKRFTGRLHVETGMDSVKRGYYKPDFRFDLSLPIVDFFAQLYYYQFMDSDLRGQIDYWVIFGFGKNFGNNLKFETSINHMCRHFTSLNNPEFFNLNEIIGRLWLQNTHYKLGLGAGTYIGGSENYRTILQLNSELLRLFGSELSMRGELKIVDFKDALYEVELFLSLSKSTDFFLRRERRYALEGNYCMGVRMKSAEKIERYIDSLNVATEIYPDYENHKVAVKGNFKMSFFKSNKKRMIFSTDFIAPIQRGESFLGDFNPEKMDYLISIQYLLKLSKSLYAAWFHRYSLSMPVDRDERFSDSAATGIVLKNQVDFDRVEKKIRFAVFGGYNFKYHGEVDIKLGASFIKREGYNISCDLRFNLNGEKRLMDLKLFIDIGRNVTFRPFFGLEKLTYLDPRQPTTDKFLFGFTLFRWHN